jgi:phosphoribosylamine--glycine ligase
MKILVVGNGGREHALVWRLAESGHTIMCAPGNPGIEEVARCMPVKADEHDRVVELAVAEAVDLVVIGPEAPLVAGLADQLRARGVLTFGPGADGARSPARSPRPIERSMRSAGAPAVLWSRPTALPPERAW